MAASTSPDRGHDPPHPRRPLTLWRDLLLRRNLRSREQRILELRESSKDASRENIDSATGRHEQCVLANRTRRNLARSDCSADSFLTRAKPETTPRLTH